MNEDGSVNLYICPQCKEEYTVFEDMMECWKEHYEATKDKRF